MFLDSDDKLLPETLNIFHKIINTYPNKDVYLGRYIRENQHGQKKISPVVRLFDDPKKNLKLFLERKLPFVTGSFVVKREIIKEILFPEDLKIREDFPVYGYLISICKCQSFEDPVVIIRDHPFRLRKEAKLLSFRDLKPVEFLFQMLPSEFQNFYPLALSREYLSIFRSFYLLQKYKEAVKYYHKAIKLYPKHIFLISYFKKYLKSLYKIL